MLATVDVNSYLPLGIMITIAVTFAMGVMILTRLIGPSRSGPTKGMPYESGMNPVGTARKRFNVRFYLIAMVFLLFDVEVIFLYPWATTFPNLEAQTTESLVWLGRIGFFLLTTIVAYLYGYRKGVFRFD